MEYLRLGEFGRWVLFSSFQGTWEDNWDNEEIIGASQRDEFPAPFFKREEIDDETAARWLGAGPDRSGVSWYSPAHRAWLCALDEAVVSGVHREKSAIERAKAALYSAVCQAEADQIKLVDEAKQRLMGLEQEVLRQAYKPKRQPSQAGLGDVHSAAAALGMTARLIPHFGSIRDALDKGLSTNAKAVTTLLGPEIGGGLLRLFREIEDRERDYIAKQAELRALLGRAH